MYGTLILRPLRLRARLCLAAVVVIIAASGCGGTTGGLGTVVTNIDAALNDFNAAIAGMNQQGANMASVLQTLRAQLNQDAKGLIGQVDGMLGGVVQQGNVDVKCNADFFRVGMLNVLENIRFIHFLYASAPPPIEPYACSSLPRTVDEDAVNSGNAKALTVDGFNFNPASLDPKLPEYTAVASVLDLGGRPLGNLPVAVHNYSIDVSLVPSGGYKLTAESARLVVSFQRVSPGPATQVSPYAILITPATTRPPLPTVVLMSAQFDTTNDDKPREGIIDLTLASGLAFFHQPGTDQSWYYNDNTSHIVDMTLRRGVSLTDLAGQPWNVCLTNGNSWHFNLVIRATVSDNTTFLLSYPGISLIPNSPERCLAGLLPSPIHTQ